LESCTKNYGEMEGWNGELGRVLAPVAVARIVGRCVWDCTLSGNSLRLFQDALNVLTRVSGKVRARSDWHKLSVAIEAKEQQALAQAQKKIALNPGWGRSRRDNAGPWMLALSGASALGAGGVTLGQEQHFADETPEDNEIIEALARVKNTSPDGDGAQYG
jgi:hypothetical protein